MVKSEYEDVKAEDGRVRICLKSRPRFILCWTSYIDGQVLLYSSMSSGVAVITK